MCVALEGGVNTLRTLRDEVLCHVPIVLVDGSGRITDLLATAFIFSEDKCAVSNTSPLLLLLFVDSLAFEFLSCCLFDIRVQYEYS